MLNAQTDIFILFNNAVNIIKKDNNELNTENVLNTMYVLNQEKKIDKEFVEYKKGKDERLRSFMGSIQTNVVYKKAFGENLLFLNELLKIQGNSYPSLIDIAEYRNDIVSRYIDLGDRDIFIFKYIGDQDEYSQPAYSISILTGDMEDRHFDEKTTVNIKNIEKELNKTTSDIKTILVKAKEARFEKTAMYLNDFLEGSFDIDIFHKEGSFTGFKFCKNFEYGKKISSIILNKNYLELSKKN